MVALDDTILSNNEPHGFYSAALSVLVHRGVNGDSCESTIATSYRAYFERSTQEHQETNQYSNYEDCF